MAQSQLIDRTYVISFTKTTAESKVEVNRPHLMEKKRTQRGFFLVVRKTKRICEYARLLASGSTVDAWYLIRDFVCTRCDCTRERRHETAFTIRQSPHRMRCVCSAPCRLFYYTYQEKRAITLSEERGRRQTKGKPCKESSLLAWHSISFSFPPTRSVCSEFHFITEKAYDIRMITKPKKKQQLSLVCLRVAENFHGLTVVAFDEPRFYGRTVNSTDLQQLWGKSFE